MAGLATPTPLKQLIKEKGFTIKALADLLGITQPTLFYLANGESRLSAERMFALAYYLGVSPEEVYNAWRAGYRGWASRRKHWKRRAKRGSACA